MKFIAFTLAAALLAGSALAQDMPPPGPGGPAGPGGGMMMRADTNHDGVVSREEYLAQAAQRFDRLDTNHDGKLTRDELQAAGRRMGAMRGDMPPPPPPAQPN